jgi:hypothetical protein
MNYTAIYNLTKTNELPAIITVACLKAFADIRAEAPEATNHANRMLVVALGADAVARRMVYDIAANASVQSHMGTIGDDPSTLDSDVQYLVNSYLSMESYVTQLLGA